MALRLVLVSMVAGLGVSPPAEGELATWTRSVQTWLETRIAEWDARQALEASPCEDVEVAEAPPSVPGIAELKQAIAAEPVVNPSPIVPARGEDPFVIDDRAFEAVVEEMVAGFIKEEETIAATRGRSTAETADSSTGPAADAESERSDALPGDVEGGGLDPSGTTTTTTTTEAATDVSISEPLEVEDDLYPGLAFALNREAEGISRPDTDDGRLPEDGETDDDQLSNAVRLTRDAVYAWMNLLQSQAIVALPR